MFFDWEFALKIMPKLIQALWITLEATMIGMLLAMVLGLVWTLLRRTGSSFLNFLVTFLIQFFRGTPLLVQIYFWFYVLPDLGLKGSPLQTGLIALGIHYSAYLAEVYRAGIEAVPKGQWEAARSLNMGSWQTFRSIILPQAIPPMIPVIGNYLIAMFKDTPMLSAITVIELLQTAKLIGAETFRYVEPLTIVGGLFLILSLASARMITLWEGMYVR